MKALVAALSMLLACSILGGCGGASRSLAEDEIPLVAWYAEDIAHGIDRDPFDLVNPDASDGQLQISAWVIPHLDGTTAVGHPAILAARRARWPQATVGLQAGIIVIDRRDGLLAITKNHVDDPSWRELVAEENLDRLQTARILLARGELDPRSARGRVLLQTLRMARLDYVQSVGGRSWEPTTSTSPSAVAPTTSTSSPDLLRRREP